MSRTLPQQFEIMVDFMERNGDLLCTSENNSHRLLKIQKWYELVSLLNTVTGGEPKPLVKWKKIWSDLKNNTKKKAFKLSTGKCSSTYDLRPLERRVLQLVGYSETSKSNIGFKTESYGPSRSSISPEGSERSISPPVRYFAVVNDDDEIPTRKTSSPLYNTEEPPKKKPRKYLKNEFKELTDRYFEHEQEKNKMDHEQEMARLKQNEQLLTILNRMVNVVESVAPSIQRYFERDTNGKR